MEEKKNMEIKIAKTETVVGRKPVSNPQTRG